MKRRSAAPSGPRYLEIISIIIIYSIDTIIKTRQKIEKPIGTTAYSQTVTHPSTNRALRCLTSDDTN